MASTEDRSASTTRGICPSGVLPKVWRCTCMARVASAISSFLACTVKRMGRSIKIMLLTMTGPGVGLISSWLPLPPARPARCGRCAAEHAGASLPTTKSTVCGERRDAAKRLERPGPIVMNPKDLSRPPLWNTFD